MITPKEKVDTLIVSDIHLGFKFCRAEKLLETLNHYDYDRLILNGDIFDDLDFNRLHSEDWDVLSYIRQASKTKEVVWIIGNHDGQATILSKLIGVTVHTQYIWKEGKKRCLAIHGHQFDRLIAHNRFLSYLVGWLYYSLKFFEGKNRSLTAWVRRTNRSWMRLSDEVAKKSCWYGRWLNVQLVFCGHTHVPMSSDVFGLKYYNSGSWVEFPATLITIKKGKVSLVDFT